MVLSRPAVIAKSAAPRLFSPPKIIMNSFSEATHDWGMSFPDR
jgi:hypothetical protein